MLIQPISSIIDLPRNASLQQKDDFGIEPYENGLTLFIKNAMTPLTIALQGEWGSGKTSLMNSLNNKLAEGDESNFHSVWLNTWEYALMKDSSSILFDIISGLSIQISEIAKPSDNQKQKLRDNLNKVRKSLWSAGSSLAMNKVGIDAEAIKAVWEPTNDSSIKDIRNELQDLINSCLENDGKKGFIFFIDDLDRIDPPVAVQLLELLKNIFTLENSIFVLAIDYDVVVKGLEPKFGVLTEKNEREFRSFFDKIIQLPFTMPVTSYKINEFLKESLITINYLTQEQGNKPHLIKSLSEICNLSVGNNPRALKRLLNSLSLIGCINAEKENKSDGEDDSKLNGELELLTNFSLVSIQIAYPAVYSLLSQFGDFTAWNENVAIQRNLKPLDQFSLEKLNKSEEFDEEWEQILFRLCENDYYLKKKALNISRLLNKLKVEIEKDPDGSSVGEVIEGVISLSSVTNLEAFDKPVQEYHRGSFLKRLRKDLIPQLKKDMPELAPLISPQGARVQSNAYIKFSKENWGQWINLSSKPFDGGIRLSIYSNKKMLNQKHRNLLPCIEEANLKNTFEVAEAQMAQIAANHPEFRVSKLSECIMKHQGHHTFYLYATYLLPSIEDFRSPEHLQKISAVIKEIYPVLLQLDKLRGGLNSNFS